MQTVGAKRYFLSLVFSFRNSAKTFAAKNAHAGTRGTAGDLPRIVIALSRSGESRRTRRVVIEYVISTSFDGNEDSLYRVLILNLQCELQRGSHHRFRRRYRSSPLAKKLTNAGYDCFALLLTADFY